MVRNIFHLLLLVVGIFITVAATAINLYMAIKGGPSGPTCDLGKTHSFQGFCKRNFIDDYEHCYSVID